MLHARQPARQKGPASGSADSLTSLLGSSLDTGDGTPMTLYMTVSVTTSTTPLAPYTLNSVVSHRWQRPGIRGTQVKSSGNKNRMSPSRSSDAAYFSETPPSWHVR